VIIGVLTGILMPIAIHSAPDKNVMKFKKADTTLKNVIHELVTSDKYYKDGDLGIRYDGVAVKNTDNTRNYFCNTIADVLSVKKVKCANNHTIVARNAINGKLLADSVPADPTPETIKEAKDAWDSACKSAAKVRGKEIELVDGTVIYKVNNVQFGTATIPDSNGVDVTGKRMFSPPNQFPAFFSDLSGFDVGYNPICIDIDGFNETKGSDGCDDVKDICPFGYGIRADGKIMEGTRAEEWLEKDFQKGKNEN